MKKEQDHKLGLYLKIRRIMKIATILIFVGIIQISATTYAQEHRISVTVKNGTFYDVVSQIEKQSDFMFFYKSEEINNDQRIDLKAENKLISDILNEITQNNDLTYKITGKHIIITKAQKGGQESKKVTGTVTDENGEPIIGANVMVKGAATGCITDLNGTFSLEVQSEAILQISFIGYVSQELKLNGKLQLKIILKEDSQALDEVVIVGYGSVKKQNLTSSVSKISTEAIQERPISTLGDAFQGQLAGVRAQNTSGIPGEDLQIRVRGVNTINGNGNPLYVIDGVPREDMNDLNPGDVASIQVLKDASATSIYGARGANGVILIETKQGVGKPTVSFDAYYGLQDPEKSIQLMDSKQWLAYHIWRRNLNYLRRGGSMKDPMSMRAESERIPDSWLTTTTNTDWQDAITETAPIQSYQISASAKGDIGNIFLHVVISSR